MPASPSQNDSRVDVDTYGDASERLQTGEADAAFFLSATPAVAVRDVVSSGCCDLLDLGDERDSIKEHAPDLRSRETEIASYTYVNQPASVQTLGASVLRVARRDLNNEIVAGLLNTAYDHLSEFETHRRNKRVSRCR